MGDVLISGEDTEEVQRMSTCLLANYRSRNQDVADKLLGVGVTVVHECSTLDRRGFAESVVVEGMGSTWVRKIHVPLDPGVDLSKRKVGEEKLDISQFPCARILGELMFLTVITRPDPFNAVRELGRRTGSPCLRHGRGLKHILHFLGGTLDACLLRYGVGTLKTEEALTRCGLGLDERCRNMQERLGLPPANDVLNSEAIQTTGPRYSSSEAGWTAMVQGMRHCTFEAFWERWDFHRVPPSGFATIVAPSRWLPSPG